jgi:hypothetical protein
MSCPTVPDLAHFLRAAWLIAGASDRRLCRTFGGDAPLAEQDSVAQESEPGPSVHLPLDHFRLVVDSLGAPVVEGHGERGGDGLDVQVKAAGEGVQVGQVGGPGGSDPLLQSRGVARAGGQQGREGRDEAGKGGHLRAGRGEPASISAWAAVRLSGLVSRIRAARRCDRCGRSASRRPWFDVADEQVGAALVAALADLPQ